MVVHRIPITKSDIPPKPIHNTRILNYIIYILYFKQLQCNTLPELLWYLFRDLSPMAPVNPRKKLSAENKNIYIYQFILSELTK